MIRKLPKQQTLKLEVGSAVGVEPHAKPRAVAGYVTLTEMAATRGMQAQLARLYMKRAKVKKPKGGWRWPIGSKEIPKVNRVLEQRL